MSDGALLGMWAGVLVVGLGTCVALHRLGVPRTYVRDLLHVGTGVWVLGFSSWDDPRVPVALTLAALAGVVVLPLGARVVPLLGRVRDSVSGDDERWTGIVLYVAAYAGLTWEGVTLGPTAAATALLALSLGDGVGGAVGRRFGRHGFTLPWGKRKSWEGAAAVGVFAAAGAVLAGWWFDGAVNPLAVGVTAVVAPVAEALAPRSTDNLLVPAAVRGALLLTGGGF